MWWKKSEPPARRKAAEYTEGELLDEVIRSRGGILKDRFPWDPPPRRGIEGLEDRRVSFPYGDPKGPMKPVRDHELFKLKERVDAVNVKLHELSEGNGAWENQAELERLGALREHLHARMGDLCEDAAAYEREAAEHRLLEEPPTEAEVLEIDEEILDGLVARGGEDLEYPEDDSLTDSEDFGFESGFDGDE